MTVNRVMYYLPSSWWESNKQFEPRLYAVLSQQILLINTRSWLPGNNSNASAPFHYSSLPPTPTTPVRGNFRLSVLQHPALLAVITNHDEGRQWLGWWSS